MGLLDRIEGRSSSQRPDRDTKGFLGKAMNVRGPSLDQACVDRILRLAKGSNSAYTALSLLKTSYPFDAALCFEKKGSGFQGYVSFSIETKEVPFTIPFSRLQALPENGFIKVEHPGEYGFSMFPDSPAWLFAIDEARTSFLLLTESPGLDFSADSLAMVIKNTQTSFLNHGKGTPETATPIEESLRTAINRHQKGGKLHMLILETEESQSLFTRAGAITDTLGTPLQLPLNRLLVILEPSVDLELFAHRLVKSLSSIQEIRVLHSARDIEATSTFGMLKNYL